MLYTPIADAEPITKQRLICLKARIVDAWREDGQLVQLYRTPTGETYRGPADARRNQRVFQPVQPVE